MRMPLDWLRTALWPISHLFAVAIIPLVLPQTLATPYDHGTTSTNYRAISVSSSQPFSCVFTLGHYSFNLCPLIAKGFSSRPTHVEDAGRSGVPAGMGASWTPSSLRSASAAVDSLTDIGQVESMLALVLGGTTQIPRTLPSALTVSIKYDEGRLGDLHGSTILSLHLAEEGRPEDVLLRLAFVCDRYTNAADSVRHTLTEDGVQTIEWKARAACPTSLRSGSSALTGLNGGDLYHEADDDSEGESQEDQPDDGDGSFVDAKPKWGTAKQWIAGFALSACACLIITSIIASSPRARFFVLEKGHAFSSALFPVASTALTKIRPIARKVVSLLPVSFFYISPPFRQRDGQLVQWAEEDMCLQEDFMVNGLGAYELDGEDWNGGELDEYIPLKLSVRSARKVRSYGSMPLREAFVPPSAIV